MWDLGPIRHRFLRRRRRGWDLLLETERVSTGAVIAGLAIGALATMILVVNNLRDRENDARVGKRTLAVRFKFDLPAPNTFSLHHGVRTLRLVSA